MIIFSANNRPFTSHISKAILFAMLVIFSGSSTMLMAQENLRKHAIDLRKYKLTEKPNSAVFIEQIKENNTIDSQAVTKNLFSVIPNQTYVMRTQDKQIKVIDSSRYQLLDRDLRSAYRAKDLKVIPELFVQSSTSSDKDIIYEIGFVSNIPLEYNFDRKKFEGTIKFLLLSQSGSNTDPLKNPVLVEVVSTDIRLIEPHRHEIKHLSIPFTEIGLSEETVNDSAHIKILTKSFPNGYDEKIPVEPVIEIYSGRQVMQGLGVQSIPINIRLIGSTRHDSIRVNFNPEKGTVTPRSVLVSGLNPGTVYLRSEGLGNARLSAAAGFRTNELVFNYRFPWIFLFMALVGGVLGGSAKYVTSEKKPKFKMAIIKGIILGLFGSIVYYALGFSLIAFEVSDIFNEFAVLGFSSLMAFFGVRVKG